MKAPDITIYVRHSKGCKYEGDESAKRCDCRKWLRWTAGGKQHREPAGTRSWAEAERVKREHEDRLAGRGEESKANDIAGAIASFIIHKQVEGNSEDAIGKYARELARLQAFCEGQRVYTVQGLTASLLTDFANTWKAQYPSSTTRSHVRTRCRSFLRYCYEAQWIPRIPAMPRIRVDEIPTMPLSADEFDHLLATVEVVHTNPQAWRRKANTRALFLLMRYSGLSILDALTLKKTQVKLDATLGLHRVTTKRQKTGVHVSVLIPPFVADALQSLETEHPLYFFWSGVGDPANFATKMGVRNVAPVFKAAGLYGEGHMVSHRLRDTFAVDLLEKGVPLEEVSKALGHESIKTTEKSYARWVIGRQDRLDSLIAGSWSK